MNGFKYFLLQLKDCWLLIMSWSNEVITNNLETNYLVELTNRKILIELLSSVVVLSKFTEIP